MDRTVLWLVAAALLMFAFDASARFVSVDPVQANPNNGQNFNRYYYANNNPYRFTDPDGRQSREFNLENQKLGIKPPPRSEKDWLGPVIGKALIGVVAAPLAGYGYGYAAANPVAANNIFVTLGEIAGVSGAARYGPGSQAGAVVASDRTAQAIASTLLPNGRMVGEVFRGATPEVRTVSPAAFGTIRQSLSRIGAVEGGGNPGYRGTWYTLPNGQGGFGIRNSSSGPAMDINISGLPKGYKIHQGE